MTTCHCRALTSAALSALLLAAAAAQSGLPTHRIRNSPSPQGAGGFGTNGRALQDFDGDGYPDYAVAAPNYPLGLYVGRVSVYSGRTSALLANFDGDQAGSGFGLAIADVGDVDKDGRRDLVVGAPDYDASSKNSVGRVFLFSGKTGAVLWFKTGTNAADRLGAQIEVLGKTDSTTTNPVLAVAEPGHDTTLQNVGRVQFLDAATGGFLGEAVGLIALRDLGVVMASYPEEGVLYASDALGDVWVLSSSGSVALLQAAPAGAAVDAALSVVKDRLGRLWVVIGRSLADTNGKINNGTVEVLGLTSSTPVLRIQGTSDGEFLGSVVASTRDVDGDGEEEIGFQVARSALLTETRIATLTGAPVPGIDFAASGLSVIGSMRDVTGDGRGEWLQFVASGVALRYEALLFSRGQRITSLSTPGDVLAAYALDMSAGLGTLAYVQLYGLSGTAPGTPLPGSSPLLPLNFDGVTQTALALANSPVFPGAIGVLDAQGRATSSMAIPAAVATALKGLDLVSATAVLVSGSRLEATNPTAVRFP